MNGSLLIFNLGCEWAYFNDTAPPQQIIESAQAVDGHFTSLSECQEVCADTVNCVVAIFSLCGSTCRIYIKDSNYQNLTNGDLTQSVRYHTAALMCEETGNTEGQLYLINWVFIFMTFTVKL